MRLSVFVLLWIASTFASAQESAFHAELRREGERVADACNGVSPNALASCGYTVFTDHPLHIAAGSMPPQNGFGVGAAFVWSKNTPNWRLSWDLDAVGATSASWRVGGYMTMVHTPKQAITVIKPGSNHARTNRLVHPYTVLNLYAQAISLNKLNYFGIGNDTLLPGASAYGMTQTIVGGRVIKPVFEWRATSRLNLALLGEINGRFVNIREENGQSAPTIQNLYTDATAPGLNNQPGFLQFGEGIRIKPIVANRFELNYLAQFQHFVAPSTSQNSFHRWTIDLNHTYYLYGYTKTAPKNVDTNGPDSCAPSGERCPPISRSRNLNGSVAVRILMSESIYSAASAVPFYFQHTLGGSDIDGMIALPSYRDYRYRAPNILLMQESFEHSIWGPLGLKLMADQGRVAATRDDLEFSHLRHSYAGGLTLRAGAFPMVFLMFAWGGPEGHHNIFGMNTSLLGGSSRPSLH